MAYYPRYTRRCPVGLEADLSLTSMCYSVYLGTPHPVLLCVPSMASIPYYNVL